MANKLELTWYGNTLLWNEQIVSEKRESKTKKQ